MQEAITMYNPQKPQEDYEKTYLVLFEGTDEDGDEYRDYDFIVGSDNVIIAIMERIAELDIFKSQVVLQDKHISLFDRITVLDFIKHRIRKTQNNPAGNDLIRLGFSDFDLNNFIENALLQNDIGYQTQPTVSPEVPIEDNVDYNLVEGEDV